MICLWTSLKERESIHGFSQVQIIWGALQNLVGHGETLYEAPGDPQLKIYKNTLTLGESGCLLVNGPKLVMGKPNVEEKVKQIYIKNSFQYFDYFRGIVAKKGIHFSRGLKVTF